MNRLRRSITRTHNKYESFLSKLLTTKKPSRLADLKLVSKKSEHPISCQEKWKKDIASDINESFNWKMAYQISFKCTKSYKLIYFNFKFLHRRLATYSFLQKIGIKDKDKCVFCQKERETLIHLFGNVKKQELFGMTFPHEFNLVKFPYKIITFL